MHPAAPRRACRRRPPRTRPRHRRRPAPRASRGRRRHPGEGRRGVGPPRRRTLEPASAAAIGEHQRQRARQVRDEGQRRRQRPSRIEAGVGVRAAVPASNSDALGRSPRPSSGPCAGRERGRPVSARRSASRRGPAPARRLHLGVDEDGAVAASTAYVRMSSPAVTHAAAQIERQPPDRSALAAPAARGVPSCGARSTARTPLVRPDHEHLRGRPRRTPPPARSSALCSVATPETPTLPRARPRARRRSAAAASAGGGRRRAARTSSGPAGRSGRRASGG